MTDPILLLAQQAPHMSDAELRAVLALVAIANGRPEFVATYEDIKQAAGGRLSSTDGVAKGLKGDVLEMYFGRGKRRSEWKTLCLTEQTLRLTEESLYLAEAGSCEYPVDNSQTLRPTEQTLRPTEQTLRLTEELQNPNALLNRENTLPNRENTPPNRAKAPFNRVNEGATSHAGARAVSSSSFNTSSKEDKEKKEEETRTRAPARKGRKVSDAQLKAWLAEHAPSDDQRKAWRLLSVHADVAPTSVAMADILANTPLEGADGIRAHVEVHKAHPKKYPTDYLITSIRYGPKSIPSLEGKAEPSKPKWEAKAEQEFAELASLLEIA